MVIFETSEGATEDRRERIRTAVEFQLLAVHELNRATLFKSSGRLYIYCQVEIKHLSYTEPSFEQHILNVSSLGLT
jgi:hypothetical protein